jgi:CRISPR-associated protein Cas1
MNIVILKGVGIVKKDMFVFNNGRLCRKDNTLMFEGEEGKKYIPVNNVESIYIFGEVDVNKSFLEFVCSNKITIHFFNYYEYYVGTFYPREYLNSGYVILKQSEAYLNYEKRVIIAKTFIDGAIKNILQVLKYYERRNSNLEGEIEEITNLLDTLQLQSTIETIMAIEGNVRQVYYKSFNKILDDEDFAFTSRTKRPPKDRINSLISFGNSMLYTLVLSQLYQTQLDPRIGYLHSTNDRRFSLNLDVAEIFKPIIVDRTIFSVINKKIITKKDFNKDLGSIILSDEGRMKFIKEFNEKLETTIKYPNFPNRVSYKRLIRLEAYKLQKFITEDEQYLPFIAKW